MDDAAKEIASEVKEEAKETAGEVKEVTLGAAEIITLALTAGFVVVALGILFFTVSII